MRTNEFLMISGAIVPDRTAIQFDGEAVSSTMVVNNSRARPVSPARKAINPPSSRALARHAEPSAISGDSRASSSSRGALSIN